MCFLACEVGAEEKLEKMSNGAPGYAEVSSTSESTRARRVLWLHNLFAGRELGIVAVAVLTFLIFSVAAPHFLSLRNLIGILREASLMCIVAVGMTSILVAG